MLLFHLSSNTTGGWVTFASHLAKSVRLCHQRAAFLKIGSRTEKNLRSFGYGEQYQNVSIDEACRMAAGQPSLITAMDKRHIEPAAKLMEAGAWCVVHDPTELNNAAVAIAHKRIISVRRSMWEHLPFAHYIPHPYVRHVPPETMPAKAGAISISRIDFDKHTAIILDANRVLSHAGQPQIEIRGFENRLYTRFKIIPDYPEWVQSKAAYPRDHDAAYKLCLPKRYMVDMSEIKGDGGGTQYTTLEAMDAGCLCVINWDWLRSDGEMRDYLNCLTVTDPASLAATVEGKAGYSPSDENFIRTVGNAEVLKAHSPEIVGPQYLEVVK